MCIYIYIDVIMCNIQRHIYTNRDCFCAPCVRLYTSAYYERSQTGKNTPNQLLIVVRRSAHLVWSRSGLNGCFCAFCVRLDTSTCCERSQTGKKHAEANFDSHATVCTCSLMVAQPFEWLFLCSLCSFVYKRVLRTKPNILIVVRRSAHVV